MCLVGGVIGSTSGRSSLPDSPTVVGFLLIRKTGCLFFEDILFNKVETMWVLKLVEQLWWWRLPR